MTIVRRTLIWLIGMAIALFLFIAYAVAGSEGFNKSLLICPGIYIDGAMSYEVCGKDPGPEADLYEFEGGGDAGDDDDSSDDAGGSDDSACRGGGGGDSGGGDDSSDC